MFIGKIYYELEILFFFILNYFNRRIFAIFKIRSIDQTSSNSSEYVKLNI